MHRYELPGTIRAQEFTDATSIRDYAGCFMPEPDEQINYGRFQGKAFVSATDDYI